jgi:serralysin
MPSKAELSELNIPNSNLSSSEFLGENTLNSNLSNGEFLGENTLNSNLSNGEFLGTNTYNRIRNPKPNPSPSPNFVRAQGDTIFSNYSQNASGTLTVAQADTLVKGGVGLAIAQAGAIFNNDPTFSALFTDSTVIALDGQFTGNADSQANVLANFKVSANETLSFDFLADFALTAKEIENPNVEYNKAGSKSAFLVLDTTNIEQPKLLDYFGIRGDLISSKKIGNLNLGGSSNVKITSRDKTSDIDGNNGQDFLTGKATGTYSQKFNSNKNITLVEINASAVELAGDTLIGNLGKDVIYGTIWNDNLKGTDGADRIYASLGNDRLDGNNGNDILEAGQGSDRLNGGWGNDKLYGGLGDDVLIGGRGSDLLVGGQGYDQFVFRRGDSLKGDKDVIQDFQVGTDKIVFQNWGNPNSEQWLNQMISLGNITDTPDGVLFKFDGGGNEGTLLVAGVSSNLINSQSFLI